MADETNKDQEIPVEIIDGETTVDAFVEGDKKPEAEKIVSGEEGAEELKRRLDAETQRREAAEATARTATEQAIQAKGAVEDGELREIETSIAVTKRNLELARQQYRSARAGNDVDAELEANEAIAQAKADLNALEAGKAAREQAKKNSQPQQQPQPQRIDPAEGWAMQLQAQNRPRAAQWVRAHADIARVDSEAIAAASKLAIRAGLAEETDGYFAHIENTLQANRIMPMPAANGNGNGTVQKTEESVMSQASRSVPPAAAPPSRSGSAPTGQRPGTIRLTREQAEMAELSFPNLVKEKGAAAAHRAYAQAMVEAKANGKIN